MPESQAEQFRLRPEIQRTEIGPIFHDLAHKVYDKTESMIAEGLINVSPVPRLLGDLSKSLAEVSGVAQYQAQNMTMAQPFREIVSPFLAKKQASSKAHDYMQRFSPVTVPEEQLIREGISSGIAMPVRLFEVIKVAENEDLLAEPVLPYLHARVALVVKNKDPVNIDASEVAEHILSPDFLIMLHQLSHVTNGFLGTGSQEVSRIGAPTCFSLYRGDEENYFAFEDGHVVGFSEQFLADKKAYLQHAADHRLSKPGAYSGGCPVRHAAFPKLGDAAARYLQEVNDDGRPVNEGESAITRGARLVAFALRHSLEKTDA